MRRDKTIEDAKHLAIQQVWNRVYNMGDIYGHLADLEYMALMNASADYDKVKGLGDKPHGLPNWRIDT